MTEILGQLISEKEVIAYDYKMYKTCICSLVPFFFSSRASLNILPLTNTKCSPKFSSRLRLCQCWQLRYICIKRKLFSSIIIFVYRSSMKLRKNFNIFCIVCFVYNIRPTSSNPFKYFAFWNIFHFKLHIWYFRTFLEIFVVVAFDHRIDQR